VADVTFNVESIIGRVDEACVEHGAKVVVLPELCVTGYTCEDLFWQDALLDAAEAGIAEIAARTAEYDALVILGAPVRANAKLYNCAIAISSGTVLGVVPKRNIPTYNEFYESRHFAPGPTDTSMIDVAGQLDVPFGTISSSRDTCPLLSWRGRSARTSGFQPAVDRHAQAGGDARLQPLRLQRHRRKSDYRRSLVTGKAPVSSAHTSTRALAGASRRRTSSSPVMTWWPRTATCSRRPFGAGVATSEIDLQLICAERRACPPFAARRHPRARAMP